MMKMNSNQRRQTERAMIDALLKISEIVKKTEKNRNQSTQRTNRKSIGDGDKMDDLTGGQVPVSPPMRTLDSYVSTFNQQQTQQPSNCNRAPVVKPMANGKRTSRDESDDCSSISSSSFGKVNKSKKTSTSICQNSHLGENPSTMTTCQSQITSYHVNSAATTILDDQSLSVMMMPITSAPTIAPGEKTSFQNPNDFNTLIDEQLQKTLRNHLISSDDINPNHSKQTKPKLTRSETGKLFDHLNLNETRCDVEHYEKQRRTAMLAAKEGNYALSFKIYTNLLHDPQYNSQMKSEILASRATTLLLEEKYFQSIDDCTQAVAYNQWNKLAYVVRAACWMIKQEYGKAVEDYSRLFHLFDQSQHVLDLLNLAYEKYKKSKESSDDEESIRVENDQQNMKNATKKTRSSSLALASPVASFVQPAVYLCYPYKAYPSWYSNNDEQCQPALILPKVSQTSNMTNDPVFPTNNNAFSSTSDENKSDLIWIKNPLTKIYS